MSSRHPISERDQLDLFRARPGDLAPRDAQDLMAYPFFSLAKSKRLAPIDFKAGSVLIRVEAVPAQGTRIIGQYDNNVGFGQSRVLLAWNRLIFPNGRSIVLERQPGADAEGYAGLQDGVDYHWWELFKAAALSTLLSVGSEAGNSGNESDIARALREGASNSTSQIGQQIVGRQLNIAPTLTIRPGFPVRVIVTHDLVLEPYGS